MSVSAEGNVCETRQSCAYLTNALERVCCLREVEQQTAFQRQHIKETHVLRRMPRMAAYKHTHER